MLCNWASTANNSFRKLAHKHAIPSIGRQASLIASPFREPAHVLRSSLTSQPLSFAHTFHNSPSSHHRTATQFASPSSSPPPFPIHAKISSDPSSDLKAFSRERSPAEVSRAVASAIRLALQNDTKRNGQWDAFHLYHSVRWSWQQYAPAHQRRDEARWVYPAKFQPIDLGQAVSPKLARHALIHGLLRARHIDEAGRLTRNVMKEGVELHCRTFETVVSSLTGMAKVPVQTTQPLTVLALRRKVFRLQDVLPAEPLLHLPIILLRNAHKHRYQRTQFIYETLIKACLIHGEILVASLLLALLIKDYELRKYCKGLTKEQAEPAAMKDATAQPDRMPRFIPKCGIAYLPDKPPHMILHEVAKCISQGISEGPDSPSFHQYSQGLANLVSLLDRPLAPVITPSSLIKLMALYPQNNTVVWIRRHGNRIERGNAFDYFHEFLFTTIKGLIPSTNVPYSGPPLNTAAYNTLLNYCLRHRCDVALADGVIKHMTTLRQPPLKPDITTYNILLRSATLLRRNDIAAEALSIVRESDSTSAVAQCIQPVTLRTRQNEGVVPRPNQEIARLFSSIYKGDLRVPASSIELEADRYTLCSYIAYLTATGNVEAVADVLVQLVPEFIGLTVPDTPSLLADGGTETPASARLRELKKAAQRTVVLGPYFFASVLNALSKAGRTGLCERVWRFAKLSEEASWTTPDPWMLTMHSYTAMMQCYAKEARKGLMMRRIAIDGSVELTSDAPNNEFVVGWAEQEMKRCAELGQPEQRRARLALLMGERVYRTMQNACQVFWQLRAAYEDCAPGLTPPEPDARFYNALLDLLGHAYLTHARRKRASRSRWRHRVRQANERWREEGILPPYWRSMIEAVVHDMQARGFHVPVWYHTMMIGRTDGAPPSIALNQPRNAPRTGSQVKPVAFPKKAARRFKPHALHTEKTKGLPIRRQGWASNVIEH